MDGQVHLRGRVTAIALIIPGCLHRTVESGRQVILAETL